MYIIKKITVLCVVIVFGVAYPMKRSLEKNSFELSATDQCATFISLKGFPLTSLNKGTEWFASLSDTDKRDVTQVIMNHNDERLALLFNIVTKLPLDIRKTIAGHLYSDDKQMDTFMGMPIQQAYCYQGSLDILNDKNNRSFAHQYRLTHEPRMQPDVICNIAKEITILWNTKPAGGVRNKSELEAILKVVDAFQGSVPDGDDNGVKYQYYELFTLKKFIQQDLRYLPFFLSVFITLALPSFYACGTNERNVHFNKVAHNFNAEAVCAYQKTGSKQFLESRVSARDEHEYCPSLFLFMKGVSWLSVGIPAYDVITEVNSRRVLFSDETMKKDMVCFFASLLSWIAIEFISRNVAEQPTLGASCVTGLYLLACAVYNATIKKHTKQSWVAFNKLPELLQRRDIDII